MPTTTHFAFARVVASLVVLSTASPVFAQSRPSPT